MATATEPKGADESTAVRCLVCSEPALEDLVWCGTCGTPAHAACWQYNGRCAVYACTGVEPTSTPPVMLEPGSLQMTTDPGEPEASGKPARRSWSWLPIASACGLLALATAISALPGAARSTPIPASPAAHLLLAAWTGLATVMLLRSLASAGHSVRALGPLRDDLLEACVWAVCLVPGAEFFGWWEATGAATLGLMAVVAGWMACRRRLFRGRVRAASVWLGPAVAVLAVPLSQVGLFQSPLPVGGGPSVSAAVLRAAWPPRAGFGWRSGLPEPPAVPDAIWFREWYRKAFASCRVEAGLWAGTPGSLDAVKRALAGDSAIERADAALTLALGGQPIDPSWLAPALADPDARVRRKAVEALAFATSEIGTSVFETAVRDPVLDVRRAAVRALAFRAQGGTGAARGVSLPDSLPWLLWPRAGVALQSRGTPMRRAACATFRGWLGSPFPDVRDEAAWHLAVAGEWGTLVPMPPSTARGQLAAVLGAGADCTAGPTWLGNLTPYEMELALEVCPPAEASSDAPARNSSGCRLDDLIRRPWLARACEGDWTARLAAQLRRDLDGEPGAAFPTIFIWHLTWVWRLGLPVDSLHVRVALPALHGWPSIALALLETRLGAPETAAAAARKCRQDPEPEVRQAAGVLLALLGRPVAD